MKQSDLQSRIKQLRVKHDLSQSQLASLVGVSQSAIAQIESGMSESLKAETLMRLTEIFNVSARYIMRGE